MVGIGGEDVVDLFENMNVLKEATIGRLVAFFHMGPRGID